jgi:hypothetical protein
LWAYGPEGAPQRVTGPALDFCLLVTQRAHRADLAVEAVGPDADRWLDIAQAFAGPPGAGRPPKPKGAGQSDVHRPAPLRIGNASGFYGDRFDALREMLTGGQLDVLTGDYLAELTMLILGRDRLKDPGAGYARTFLKQLEECLGLAQERGVRIVTNAGGLNPAGLADAVRKLADRLGDSVRVAHVEGTISPLGIRMPLPRTPISAASVSPPVSMRGPTSWSPGGSPMPPWSPVPPPLTSGGGRTTTTGSRVLWSPDMCWSAGPRRPAATTPSSPSTRPRSSAGPAFRSPRFTKTAPASSPSTPARAESWTSVPSPRSSSTRRTAPGTPVPTSPPASTPSGSEMDGPDRVRIEGVRGEAPPPTLKVGLNRLGGFRNEVTFVLTGLDIERKATLVREQMEAAFGEGNAKSRPGELRWDLARTDHADASTEETASALLRLVVRDSDQEVVGRALSAAAVELALASYPGFHVLTPPGKGAPYGVFDDVYVPHGAVDHVAVLYDGRRVAVAPAHDTLVLEDVPQPALPEPPPDGPTTRAPLGLVAGARSGDKGGNANVGVWARTDEAWRWLAHALTVERFRQLLPETGELGVTARAAQPPCPQLRRRGILGEGVAAQHRFDPQAKALGEWLRSRRLDIPEVLL